MGNSCTISDLITEINAFGLKVNNLFQRTDDVWQANIREGEVYFQFGYGQTPEEALAVCWAKTQKDRLDLGLDLM